MSWHFPDWRHKMETPDGFPEYPEYGGTIQRNRPQFYHFPIPEGRPVSFDPSNPAYYTQPPSTNHTTPSNTPSIPDPVRYPGTYTPPRPSRPSKQVDDLEDFLHLVAQLDDFADDDDRTVKSEDQTERGDLELGTVVGPPPQQESELLQKFQKYWKDQEEIYGKLPTVQITLDNAHAAVQVLKPRKQHKLDNMWTPIARVFRWCAGRKVRQELNILNSISTTFEPGTMTLLVGDPGSGKTTLLRMLAGRLHRDRRWNVGGIYLNGEPIEDTQPAQYVSLIDDSDVHIPTLTVRDTLLFAYRCNSENADKDHVDTILGVLGLSHVANTVVGDQEIRGCSGGERRRVTVGEMWAANVRVLLADRMTDGLDSQATLDLVKAIRIWKNATQATVVLSLLQPPPEVYKYFDNVCVMRCNDGPNLIYHGPIRTAANQMRQLGYEDDRGSFAPSMALDYKKDKAKHRAKVKEGSPYKRSYFVHLWLLIKRQYRLEFFNVGLVISRLVLNLLNGLLTASLFKTTINDERALFVRSAMMYHTCMTVVISVVNHIGLFGADRPVFYKQRGAYFFHSSAFWIAHNFFHVFFWAVLESLLLSVTSYWLSGFQPNGGKFLIFWMAVYLLNITSTIVFKILAIVCESVGIAQTWAGLIQVIFFIFSGFLQPWVTIPAGWKWARWISPQSYSFSIMLINEFVGVPYYCTTDQLQLTGGECPYTTGDAWIISFFGIGLGPTDLTIADLFLIFVAWFLFYFLAGLVAIHFVKWNRRIMHRLKEYEDGTEQKQFLMTPPLVTLSWEGISYTVKQKKAEPKTLLHGVSGIIHPSMMTALMGPSGAGKTTLLDVLAGRKTGGETQGTILVNGHPKEQASFNRISGYVEQFNCQVEILTVGEALDFSARLRLMQTVSRDERRAFVRTVIEMLELQSVYHEQISNILADQKKRVSVGVEVVSGPSILFLDEPTTGLDSLGALVLVRALTRLRDDMRVAIVCTIHQPSKELFHMFDRLVLMAKGGRLVFASDLGPESSLLIDYLQGAPGVAPIRRGENPAVWMLQQIGSGVSPDPMRMEAIVAHWPSSGPGRALDAELAAIVPGESVETGGRYNLGFSQQFNILLDRCMRIYWRSSSYNLVRTTELVIIAILLGTVYWQLNYNVLAVWPRLALLYTASFYSGLTFIMSSITLLMPLRPSYYKERSSGAYSPWAYGFAYLVAELPYVTVNALLSLVIVYILSELYYIEDNFWARMATYWLLWLPYWLFLLMCTILGHALSAISPTLEVANAIGPGMASWFSSFAGFYMAYPDIPPGYTWLYWLNPFRYCYEALVLTQFPGRPLTCTNSPVVNSSGDPVCIYTSGDGVITYMGMLTWGYGLDIGVLVGYTGAFVLVTLLGLRFLRFGSK
jgi:ABC-type multidrug transport system ATPase subunit/ABC-type multidrug transport system permease subunit